MDRKIKFMSTVWVM